MNRNLCESNLHRCNCRNDSARVDPSFHEYHCDYRKWFIRRFGTDEFVEDKPEQKDETA